MPSCNYPLPLVHNPSRPGSVLLVVVLLVALLAAVVMGHLQINTEEIQLLQNQLGGAEALAIAEAGLNDALAQLQQDPHWRAGFTAQPFDGGAYTVLVEDATVTATGQTARGFVARVAAEVTPGPGGTLQVERWRINP